MITITPNKDPVRFAFRLECTMPGCKATIAGVEETVDDVHATIEESPWLRGLDFGQFGKNWDLCPQHAANFKAGGFDALERELGGVKADG